MSINVEVSQKDLKADNKIKVQYIPATIAGNGVMKVDEYFNNYTFEDKHVLKNSFRGYPLQGCERKLPKNLKGIVLTETEKLAIENADRDLQLSGHFDELTYWNYDKIPSKNDPYEKAQQWMGIADTLHAEITTLDDDDDDDIDSKVNIKKE